MISRWGKRRGAPLVRVQRRLMRLVGPCITAICIFGLCVFARESRAQSPGRPGPAPASTRVEAGRALYARYCQLCHAADGTGYAADEAPSLVSQTFLATANDAFIARGIRLGRPDTAMAAYGKARGGPLDDLQIASIVTFLRSKGPRAAALPAFKPAGSAARGAALFAGECQSCHGSAKKPGKAPKLYNPEFLAAASPAFLRQAIVQGRPPTRMPAFEQRLTSGQIDDLVAWLVSLRGAPVPEKTQNLVAPEDLPLVIHPEGGAPDFSLREGRFVSAEQVQRALGAKRRMILIDARSPSDWIQFHIPGSVPIPYYDTAKLDRIPNDDTWVVAYCACPHHASGEIVDALRRRGRTHTAVLDEGILFWRRAGYALEGEALGPAPAAPAAQPPAAKH